LGRFPLRNLLVNTSATSQQTTHVIGAGLAGLSSAVRMVKAGRRVVLYEAAGHAGGRCRSFDDDAIGRRIDNGNHLLLSGNRDAMTYLDLIGASDSLFGPDDAEFPFIDFNTNERWVMKPNAGRIPWWIFSATRRVPGSSPWSYLSDARIAWAGPKARVTDLLSPTSLLFKRLWDPLVVAALNTAPEEGAAVLMGPVIRETFGRGGAACLPRIARQGLSESFIDPALKMLSDHNMECRFSARVRSLEFVEDRLVALNIGETKITVPEGDTVILAVPPIVAQSLVPDLIVPTESRAIVNGHFLLPEPMKKQGFIGVIGGLCHWIFYRGDVVSTTVSAAENIVDQSAEELAETMWAEIMRALDLPESPLPAHRIVKEKRATFAQTPDQVARRPSAQTAWQNFALAGDWVNTGLPATIEGAIRSGRQAAAAVLRFVSIP
jgi:squalene-associated FAD-dependent desaturase